MNKRTMLNRLTGVFALVLAFALAPYANAKDAAAPASGTSVTITILETSDIHGMIYPTDYAYGTPFDGGLAKAATVIKTERAKDPDLLLLDCGDSVQDNLIQEFRGDSIHPMIKAMNSLNYDAWELGNHEFNFEFSNLLKNIQSSRALVLAANIYKKDGTRFVAPYIIKTVKGVRVAVVGLTAPHVPNWEASNPEHFNNMTFTTPMDELGTILPEILKKSDVIVVLAHYGQDGEYDTDGMDTVAEKFGTQVAAFLIGHEHSTFAKKLDNGTVMVEPGVHGTAVGKVTLVMTRGTDSWQKTGASAEILPVKNAGVEADKDMLALMKYVDEKSTAIAETVVGQIGADFLPSLYWKDLPGIPAAVVEDTALIDLINTVQMKTTGADVSLAALFDSSSNLTKGSFHKRDGVKVYKYDNTLMAVRVTGKQLKAIMEQQAGNFFNTEKPGDVTISFNPAIRLYNYDMFAGVNYEINISKPAGSRIENVTYKGAPLADDQVLTLALNNYRYGGLSKAGLISSRPDDLVYNSGLAVRDLISDYVAKAGTLMPECDNNWSITGIDCTVPGADKIYDAVRGGKITIPQSQDGRTPNVASLNVNDYPEIVK
jgi:5''-nucleotidase/2'',3''-cyclic phosphodiesterase and related esterases